MATRKTTSTTGHTPPQAFEPLSGAAAGLLYQLIDRASDNLTDADLTHVNLVAWHEAEGFVDGIECICNGLGGLIDGDIKAESSAGNFRDEELPKLLWALGAMAGQAREMLRVTDHIDTMRYLRNLKTGADHG